MYNLCTVYFIYILLIAQFAMMRCAIFSDLISYSRTLTGHISNPVMVRVSNKGKIKKNTWYLGPVHEKTYRLILKFHEISRIFLLFFQLPLLCKLILVKAKSSDKLSQNEHLKKKRKSKREIKKN